MHRAQAVNMNLFVMLASLGAVATGVYAGVMIKEDMAEKKKQKDLEEAERLAAEAAAAASPAETKSSGFFAGIGAGIQKRRRKISESGLLPGSPFKPWGSPREYASHTPRRPAILLP